MAFQIVIQTKRGCNIYLKEETPEAIEGIFHFHIHGVKRLILCDVEGIKGGQRVGRFHQYAVNKFFYMIGKRSST